jgi:ectoine hydroxylase-related dioxygenase (phytanoyl-CoA dioxygenase family)
MDIAYNIKEKIAEEGFAIVDNIFTTEEVDNLLVAISHVDKTKPTFRKTTDLFAIRQFFKEVPAAYDIVFNNNKLNALIKELFGDEFFVVKAIYFDKPENSNWFVSYHQDLTISVDTKTDIEGSGPWTAKHNQYAVQPPLHILQDGFTIRMHLDDTNEENGALKVIPGSHVKGIYRPETIDWSIEAEVVCTVPKGGIMIMKPLLLHSSSRTTNNNKRRVVHIEFSRCVLPDKLKWAEYIKVNAYPLSV